MVSLLPPRGSSSSRSSGRGADDVELTATVADEQQSAPGSSQPSGARYGWQAVAVGGALVAALAGWVVVAGLCVVGWLTADPGDLGTALRVGTRLWLLAHGTPAELAEVRWSVTPLAMSLLIAFMLARFARAAVRFAAPDPGRDTIRVCAMTIGLSTVGYAAAVTGVGLTSGAAVSRGVLGAVLLAAIGSAWGASRGLGLRLSDHLPGWARPLPYAVAAAVGVLLVGGVAVLVTGMVLHGDRVAGLTTGLGAGVIGGIALWVGQAFFLPNAVIWCSSYALGAGFRVGEGSVVAPAEVSLGLLPSIPVLGALPRNGPGDLGSLVWLLIGAAAGAVAALVVVRRRKQARFDETALVGGLSGVLAAAVFVGLAWTTGGDLGDGRLSGVGPRLPELAVMSFTLLGLAGMTAGFVFGLIAGRARTVAARAAAAEDAQNDPLITLPEEDQGVGSIDADSGDSVEPVDSAGSAELGASGSDDADSDPAGTDPDAEETADLTEETGSRSTEETGSRSTED